MIALIRKNAYIKYCGVLIFLLHLIIISPEYKGWSPEIYRSMCLNSVKLMPPSLKGILEIHQQDLLRGLKYYSQRTPKESIRDVEKRVNQIVAMINKQEKFSRVCFQFGQLCSLASDINNPLYISSQDPDESLYYDNFIFLTEINLNNFVLTFEGYESSLLERGKLKEFIKNTEIQSNELYPYFRRFMLLRGQPIDTSELTPRSIPFALASLCYCRSVSTTANLWLYCWKKANGDISETPFYNKKKRKKS